MKELGTWGFWPSFQLAGIIGCGLAILGIVLGGWAALVGVGIALLVWAILTWAITSMDAGTGALINIIKSVKDDAFSDPQAEETFNSQFNQVRSITNKGVDFVQTTIGKITTGVVIVGFVGTVISVQVGSRTKQNIASDQDNIQATNTMNWLVLLPDQFITSITVNPDNPNIVFASTFEDSLFRTRNGGETWELILEENVEDKFLINPNDPVRILAAWNRGIYKSSDSGDSWSLVHTSDDWIAHLFQSQSEPQIIYAAKGNGGDLVSLDYGETWTEKQWESVSDVNEYWKILSIDPQNPQRLFSQLTLFKPPSGNEINPTLIYRGAFLVEDQQSGQMIDIFGIGNWEKERDQVKVYFNPHNPSIVFACSGYDNRISTDGGYTWGDWNITFGEYKSSNWEASDGTNYDPHCGDLEFHPRNKDVIYMVTADLVRSTDGGNSWENISNHEMGTIYALTIGQGNPTQIYLGTNKGLYLAYDD